jgi:glycosyltransferase involved in cell wall biosynthesis
VKISLVTSAYKKEDVVTTQLNRLYNYLESTGYAFELIVVVDGLIDNTKAKIEEFIHARGSDNIKLMWNKENRGKGFSIRNGLKVAEGDVIGYIDADTDIEIKTLQVGLKRIINSRADVVTPSKFHKDSNIKVSLKRKLLTKGFQLISRTLLPVPKGVDDVSCGMKLFKGHVIKDILPHLHVNRFAIDSEIFFWLNRKGYSVEMTPFYMSITEGSTAANIKQIMIMMKDISLLGLQTRLLNMEDSGFALAGKLCTNLYKHINI